MEARATFSGMVREARAELEAPRGSVARRQLGSYDRRGVMEVGGRCGGVWNIDMRQPSMWSSPFAIDGNVGPREALRELARCAFDEWLSERTTPVDVICGRYGLARGWSWGGGEVAATEERERGWAELRDFLRTGGKLVLGSASPAGKACHTATYARLLTEPFGV